MRLFKRGIFWNRKTQKNEDREVDYSIAEMIDVKIDDAGQLSEDQISRLKYMIEEQSKLIGLLVQKLYENKMLSDVEIISLIPYDMKVED